MAISVADNFSYQGPKPLDARAKYETVAAMKAAAEATLYDGIQAYVSETDKYYKYLSTNTIDETTGRWREYQSGGGVTPDITATATADATSSANPTVNVTKTGTDESPNFDFSFSGLKGAKGDTGATGPQGPQGPAGSGTPLTYSTSERNVGTWIDGKPLYQKTVDLGALPSGSPSSPASKEISHGVSNVDKVVGIEAIGVRASGTPATHSINWARTDGTGTNTIWCSRVGDKIKIEVTSDFTAFNGYATLRYTKTTD